jgi:hypothetical protein
MAHPGWFNGLAGRQSSTMAAFIMLSAVLLGFAVIGELVFLGYDFATLIKVFSALPMVQKIVLLVICLAPLSLLAVALVQHRRLCGMAAGFKARLQGIRLDVLKLEEAQKDTITLMNTSIITILKTP